jgi:hypothetical protein
MGVPDCGSPTSREEVEAWTTLFEVVGNKSTYGSYFLYIGM